MTSPEASDGIILDFLNAMAGVREQFRKAHIALEANKAFRSVSVEVSPFRSADARSSVNREAWLDRGVSLAFFLNAELAKPRSTNEASLGASVLLFREPGVWIAEGEIGWTGSQGWDHFLECRLELRNIEELLVQLEDFTRQLLADLLHAASRMTNDGAHNSPPETTQ